MISPIYKIRLGIYSMGDIFFLEGNFLTKFLRYSLTLQYELHVSRAWSLIKFGRRTALDIYGLTPTISSLVLQL